MLAILPPFISPEKNLLGQSITLIAVMLAIEFFSLMVYAYFGTALQTYLLKESNLKAINRISSLIYGLIAYFLISQ